MTGGGVAVGRAVGGTAAQHTVQPSSPRYLSLLQVKVAPADTATPLGPTLPQYLVPPIWRASQRQPPQYSTLKVPAELRKPSSSTSMVQAS